MTLDKAFLRKTRQNDNYLINTIIFCLIGLFDNSDHQLASKHPNEWRQGHESATN